MLVSHYAIYDLSRAAGHTLYNKCQLLKHIYRLLLFPPLCVVLPLSHCACAQRFWPFLCVRACPVCFVSLQSADSETVPAKLFSACLPIVQASTSSPLLLHLHPPQLPAPPPSPSMSYYAVPIFALDPLLILSPSPGLLPLCSLLLISKLKTSHCQTMTSLSHALLREQSGWCNVGLQIGQAKLNLSRL